MKIFILILLLLIVVASIVYNISLNYDGYDILLRNRFTKLGFGIMYKNSLEIWHFAHTIYGGKAEKRLLRFEKSIQEISNLQGSWWFENKDSTFELKLKQQGNKIFGRYCAIAQNGNKIDCDPQNEEEDNIVGTIKDNVAVVMFKSYYGEGMSKVGMNVGKARIIYKGDSLEWIVMQAPKNDYFYCPDKATLVKQNVGSSLKTPK